MKFKLMAFYLNRLIKFPVLFTATILMISLSSEAQGYLKVDVRNTNCPVASHEADLWFFGQNAALDFKSGQAVSGTENDVLNALQGSSILCDSMGNLKLFTNGVQVFNRQQSVMPNGNNLHGDYGVTMPAIIIPKPGDHSIYYIFTIDRPKIWSGDTTYWGLQFSEVNINLDNGLGDVTSLKNFPLLDEVSEKISAVRHANGTDVWVVSHRFDSDEFCSFLVTANGVDTTGYVSSHSGSIHAGPANTNNSVGFMKISPDGSKLALAIQGSGSFEIFNFDPNSGKVSAAVTSNAFPRAYGVEFSSDSRYLYATTAPFNGEPGFPSTLYQFDISQGGNIFNAPTELAVNTNAEYYYGLQLGTDGRIYVARSPWAFDSLGVIYNPKRPGLSCNFNSLGGTSSAIGLSGKRSKYGLPVFIQSYFDIPHFDVENICFEDTTYFRLTNNANIDNVTWNFGDGNTSNDLEPTHTFAGPGDYSVSVTEYYGTESYTYNETVKVAELPAVELGDTLYLYQGSTLLLDAGEGLKSYIWSTGETTSSIKVKEPGTYYVEVVSQRCCFNSDSVLVKLFDVLVPNAFRPGGTNPRFRAIPTTSQAIDGFAFYIYNRWGQLIYESRDISEGWDGRINGNDAPGDVYVWVINYEVAKEAGTETVTYKGNVILLR